jgi:hypothetical protein
MRASTCLSLVILVGGLAACDDDDDSAADAAPDAPVFDGGVPEVDAAPPSAFGLWRIESVELFGITVEAGEPAGKLGRGVTRRVNGLLNLDRRLGEGGLTEVHLVGEQLDIEFSLAGASAISVNAAETELDFGNDAWTLDYDGESDPERLTASFGSKDPHVYELVRYTHEPVETFTIGGVAVAEGGETTYVNPRVTLVSVTRDAGGAAKYVVADPSPSGEPGNDFALEDFGAVNQSVSFTLGRANGALGIDRIAYGNGFASVLLVVGYEDKDENGKLDPARVAAGDDCATEGVDCVRGVSRFAVGYRAGGSAELDASPYNLLLPGWQLAYLGVDFRHELSRVPLPLDPTRAPVPVEVEFNDPTFVELPQLAF